jgi:hypothetical protein
MMLPGLFGNKARITPLQLGKVQKVRDEVNQIRPRPLGSGYAGVVIQRVLRSFDSHWESARSA